MTDREKAEVAIDFIRQVRDMPGEQLSNLILDKAGEGLAQFFLTYTEALIKSDPTRAVNNASSLLLMGYLIRMNEEELSSQLKPRPVTTPVHVN